MNERPSGIAPPPSLDDILSSTPDSRLGQVDFTSRLAPEPEPEADEVPTRSADYTDEQSLYDNLAEQTEAERIERVTTRADRGVQMGSDFAPARFTSGDPAQASTGPELDYLDLSVDQVAASVIARMREAGEASQRHLESIEDEAARRCELLTAQAELDAELIRLHARREAHAIITAARMRTGAETGADEDTARLNEIGETFSRFAESIETTVAEAPESPAHPLYP